MTLPDWLKQRSQETAAAITAALTQGDRAAAQFHRGQHETYLELASLLGMYDNIEIDVD